MLQFNFSVFPSRYFVICKPPVYRLLVSVSVESKVDTFSIKLSKVAIFNEVPQNSLVHIANYTIFFHS